LGLPRITRLFADFDWSGVEPLRRSLDVLHRRVDRYREMCIRLQAVRREIAHSQTWSGLERSISKAERVLLQEVFEWHSITSFTESH
jgi:hypothetical protein